MESHSIFFGTVFPVGRSFFRQLLDGGFRSRTGITGRKLTSLFVGPRPACIAKEERSLDIIACIPFTSGTIVADLTPEKDGVQCDMARVLSVEVLALVVSE